MQRSLIMMSDSEQASKEQLLDNNKQLQLRIKQLESQQVIQNCASFIDQQIAALKSCSNFVDFELITNSIAQRLNIKFICTAAYNHQHDEFHMHAGKAPVSTTNINTVEHDFRQSYPWLAEVVFKDTVVIADDIDHLPEEAHIDKAALKGFGIKSIAIFPAFSDGQFIGLLQCDNYNKTKNWTAEDRLIGETLAAPLLNAAINCQSENHPQKQVDLLSLVCDTSNTAYIHWQRSSGIQHFSKNFAWLFGYDSSHTLNSENADFLFYERFGVKSAKQLLEHLKINRETGESYSDDLCFYNTQGKPGWLKIVIQADKNINSIVLNSTATFTDITHLKNSQITNQLFADDASWIAQQIKNLFIGNSTKAVEDTLKAMGERLNLEIIAVELEPSLGSLSLNWNIEGGLTLKEAVADYKSKEDGILAFNEVINNLAEDRCFDIQKVPENNAPLIHQHFSRLGIKAYLFLDLGGKKIVNSFIDAICVEQRRRWSDREKYLLRTLGEAMIMVLHGIKKQERVDFAMQASQNGIWDYNLITGELYASASFANLLGYKQDELPKQYQDFQENFLHFEDLKTAKEEEREQLKHGSEVEIKLRVKHKSGKYRWILSKHIYLEHDESGRPSRCIGVFSDISSFKDQESYLNDARIAAEENAAAKGAFLANMSHEIRTPMNSILGFLSIALDSGRLPDDLAKHVLTSHSSAQSLLVIINDVLDISKFENGNVSLEKVDFNLRDAIVRSMEMQEATCVKKNISLSLSYHSELSKYYKGDPNRLKQVLINLLGNSVKFTEQGTISITVGPTSTPDRIHFLISDTGVGIAENRLESIFESFTQADESTTRRFGGTGLGTTISKQIVEAMDGRIWVESELGKGSDFHFEINLSPVAEEDVSQVYQELSHINSTTHNSSRVFKILLVDDIEQNLELAELRFDEQGHSTDLARNGLEAVEAYKRCHYDVVLMDIQMPIMDGLTACRAIREIEQKTGKHTPVIALTASVLQEDLELCYDAGMDEIVGKPINFSELFTVMENVIGEDGGTASSTPEKINKTDNNSLDLSSLSSVIDVESGIKTWRKPELYLKNLNTFIDTNQQTVSDMNALIEDDQFNEVLSLSHALKGVSGNLSMLGFAQQAIIIDKDTLTLTKMLTDKDIDTDNIRLLKDQLKTHGLALQNEYNKARSSIKALVENSAKTKPIDTQQNNSSVDVAQLKIKLHTLSDNLQHGSVNDGLLSECLKLLRNRVDQSLINQIENGIDNFDFSTSASVIGDILEGLED